MVNTDRFNGAEAALAFKAPVVVASTANLTLSGEQTIDGVAVTADQRVLVKDQSTGADNGIYVVSTGEWTRAVDFDGTRDAVGGTMVFVARGTVSGGSILYLSNTGTITIGTTALTFANYVADSVADAEWIESSAVATAGQTVVTGLTYAIGAVLVAVNGAVVQAADYVATDGGTITFADPLGEGDDVTTYSFQTVLTAAAAKSKFHAYLSADTLNVSGDATEYTVLFDTERFDVLGDYTPGTGTFTAPETGHYFLSARVGMICEAAHTQAFMRIDVTDGGDLQASEKKSTDGLEQTTLEVNDIVYMTAGDTATVIVDIRNGSKTADLDGGSRSITSFSGFQL